MPSRYRSETNLYHNTNNSHHHADTMIGPVKTIDHNDINPDLLLLGDNYIKSEDDNTMYSDTGKTFVNLDNKHWQGGSTTVLEERNLPVVFQDIMARSISPGSTTSSTSSSTGRTSRRPGRKSAATNRQEEEEFSPEEAERLKIRRERNKEAAARCRKRKLDQIETLEKQVSDWESKTSQLQKELINLKHERDELQYLLEQHSTQCRYTTTNITNNIYPTAQQQQVATTQQETILRVPSLPTTSTTTTAVRQIPRNRVVVKTEGVPTTSYSRHQTTAEQLEQQQVPVVVEEAQDVYTTIAPVTAKRSRPSRPVSLSLSVNAQNLRSIEGVPIETPTNVFTQLNFDSLMDGRTGLTPTNVLTPVNITMSALTTPTINLSSPTCSSQQRNNGSNGVSADKNVKLVSL